MAWLYSAKGKMKGSNSEYEKYFIMNKFCAIYGFFLKLFADLAGQVLRLQGLRRVSPLLS